jgi:hypothetical protein
MRAAAAAALPTPPPPSVGVDLGTSNSAVAVVVDGVPTLVPMRDGRATLPSVVHYPVDGPPLVGRAALARAAADPGRTFFSTKRLMGRSWADVEATAGGLPYPTAPADGGASVALPCDAAPGGLLTPPTSRRRSSQSCWTLSKPPWGAGGRSRRSLASPPISTPPPAPPPSTPPPAPVSQRRV